MKRINVCLRDELEKRFVEDAAENKRGVQGELDYLLEKAFKAMDAEKGKGRK